MNCCEHFDALCEHSMQLYLLHVIGVSRAREIYYIKVDLIVMNLKITRLAYIPLDQ